MRQTKYPFLRRETSDSMRRNGWRFITLGRGEKPEVMIKTFEAAKTKVYYGRTGVKGYYKIIVAYKK